MTGLPLSERVRSLQPSSTLAVSAKVKELQAAGVDVIGFGAGEPDFDTPQNIKQAAIRALEAGRTKYEAVIGEIGARRTIAAKLRDENSIECEADDICISVGAKHSAYLAMQCLLDPGKGQEVILPTPAWVSYRPMIELAGGCVVELPAAVENDLKITADQLAAAITPRTRAVILNSPSNPCGTMYTPDEIHAIADVLAAHEQVVVVSDEIYEKLIFGQAVHCSPASIESIAGRTITINGLSKAYAMTGWRIGYACAPGGFAKAMAKLQGQMTSNITSFCYPAIIEALTNCDEVVEQMRRTFEQRSILMFDRVMQMPQLRCPKPMGAFYLFPDVSAYFGRTSPDGRAINSACDFAEALLVEANVAVVPGEDFGECARAHVRLGFACSERDIEEGCSRMHAWLQSFGA